MDLGFVMSVFVSFQKKKINYKKIYYLLKPPNLQVHVPGQLIWTVAKK